MGGRGRCKEESPAMTYLLALFRYFYMVMSDVGSNKASGDSSPVCGAWRSDERTIGRTDGEFGMRWMDECGVFLLCVCACFCSPVRLSQYKVLLPYLSVGVLNTIFNITRYSLFITINA